MTKEEQAESFATEMMGIGDWSEKWSYADKYQWQTIKRSYLAGHAAGVASFAPKIEVLKKELSDAQQELNKSYHELIAFRRTNFGND